MLANQRSSHTVFTQFVDLYLMELTNWRWAWRGHLLMRGTFAPLFMMILLGFFAKDSGPEALAYILTGNMVMSLIFGTMNSIESRVEWLRFNGGLDFFATLPIQRAVFTLALVASFLLFSLPSMIITMLFGTFWLNLPVDVHPLILLVVPICAAPLAGVGALIGLTCRSREEGGNIAFLLNFILTFIGPVIVPPDRLPAIMTWVGHLSPATYAASALRQVVIGPVGSQILLDLTVLLLMAAFFLWLVGYKISWQEG